MDYTFAKKHHNSTSSILIILAFWVDYVVALKYLLFFWYGVNIQRFRQAFNVYFKRKVAGLQYTPEETNSNELYWLSIIYCFSTLYIHNTELGEQLEPTFMLSKESLIPVYLNCEGFNYSEDSHPSQF